MIDAAKVRRWASSASVATVSSSFFGEAGGGGWGVRVGDCRVCDGDVPWAANEVAGTAICRSVCGEAAPNTDSAHNQENRTKTLNSHFGIVCLHWTNGCKDVSRGIAPHVPYCRSLSLAALSRHRRQTGGEFHAVVGGILAGRKNPNYWDGTGLNRLTSIWCFWINCQKARRFFLATWAALVMLPLQIESTPWM